MSSWLTRVNSGKGTALAALLVCAIDGAQLNAQELTLTEAIQLALQNNTDIANVTLDVSKACDRSSAFRSTLFPKLSVYMLGSEQLSPISVTVDRGTLGTYPGIGPIPASDIKYTTPVQPTGFFVGRVSQPLSGIYRTRLNLKALTLSTAIAQQKVRGKRDDVVRQVKQLYYGIEQTQSSLMAAREAVKLDREVQRLTGDYVLKQTALEAQLLQADATLADAQQSELALSNQQAGQREQLNDLLGRDVLTEFSVSELADSPQSIRIDLAAARRQALAQRPELQQARLKTQQSEQEVRAKKAEYIPDISVEFNSLTLLNFNSFLPGGSYSVGASLSWEPFDWGRKKNELAEKRATVSQDKNTQASTERKIILDIDDKYRQLQQTWSKLHTTSLGQRAATEGLRVYKNQYEVKAALLQVVFQAQTTLAQANTAYFHALADYFTAQADFEHALGTDQ